MARAEAVNKVSIWQSLRNRYVSKSTTSANQQRHQWGETKSDDIDELSAKGAAPEQQHPVRGQGSCVQYGHSLVGLSANSSSLTLDVPLGWAGESFGETAWEVAAGEGSTRMTDEGQTPRALR